MIKTKKGFTLIELLIVIAIIGILAATIIPNFTPAKKKADEANFISSVKGLQNLFVLCCDQPGNPSITTPRSGTDMCAPNPINNKWPSGKQANMFGTLSSGSACSFGDFSVKFVPKAKAYGTCTEATVTNTGVYFKGCSSIENSAP